MVSYVLPNAYFAAHWQANSRSPSPHAKSPIISMTHHQAWSPDQQAALISTLAARFEQNMNRHADLTWADLTIKLEANLDRCRSLYEMERTGGEPDVVGFDSQTGEYLFYDCSAESPMGRRSLCYDQAGLESRKANRPQGNAVDLAAAMGIDLLTEAQYRALQQLGPFDAKTSSWLKTPPKMRQLGGALFGDFRFGQVFTYHNGAQSYYGARGFRGSLRV
jgi:hypothetical protein